MKIRMLLPVIMVMAMFASTTQALEIYPIHRAKMPVGVKFDFKVEFDTVLPKDKVTITVNDRPYADILGDGQYVEEEQDAAASALIVRGTSFNKAGTYRVTASDGSASKSVTWTVVASEGKRSAKNVILFIADGLSIAHRTAARVMSKGISEGKYWAPLAIDDMPHMALIGTSGVDSLITDSANAASAYNTGHKSSVNALGVYADRTKSSLDDPRQETLAELAKRKRNMAVGVVSDAELQDATPAAVFAHTRRRADKAEITEMLFNVKPEVILGGGSAYFLPQSTPGSKRKDDKNFIRQFQEAGYSLVTTSDEMIAAGKKADTRRLLGLFHPGNMDGALDRKVLKPSYVKKFPNQPDLVDMTKAALEVLSRDPNGFYLMVEAALIDKFSHPLDWERTVYDTIMFDQAVAVAKEFARQNGETLVIATGDHTHGLSIIGTVDDNKPGSDMREKIGVYADAGYPNYEDRDGDGYPDRVDVSKRLAVFFSNFPDHYETFRPKLEQTFVPAVMNEKKQYVANEAYKNVPGAMLRSGILPRNTDTGVHSADDMTLTAMGPGSERFRGFMDNTEVFHVMVQALGLASE